MKTTAFIPAAVLEATADTCQLSPLLLIVGSIHPWLAIKGRNSKQSVVWPFDGILLYSYGGKWLSNKTELNAYTWTMWINLKNILLCDSIFLTFKHRQNYSDRNQNSDCLRRVGIDRKEPWWNLLEEMEIFYFLIWVEGTWVYTFIIIHPIVHKT